MTTKNLVMLAGGVVLLAAAAGLGSRWMADQFTPASRAAVPVAEVTDPRDFRYVSLEKVLVMLRGGEGEGEAPGHYLLLDQVFKVPAKDERMLRDHLPRLRSIAVRALSDFTLVKAGRLSIDELNRVVGKAYRDDYAASKEAPPFVDTMIGKFVLE